MGAHENVSQNPDSFKNPFASTCEGHFHSVFNLERDVFLDVKVRTFNYVKILEDDWKYLFTQSVKAIYVGSRRFTYYKKQLTSVIFMH